MRHGPLAPTRRGLVRGASGASEAQAYLNGRVHSSDEPNSREVAQRAQRLHLFLLAVIAAVHLLLVGQQVHLKLCCDALQLLCQLPWQPSLQAQASAEPRSSEILS